jgi:hypothetical protein
MLSGPKAVPPVAALAGVVEVRVPLQESTVYHRNRVGAVIEPTRSFGRAAGTQAGTGLGIGVEPPAPPAAANRSSRTNRLKPAVGKLAVFHIPPQSSRWYPPARRSNKLAAPRHAPPLGDIV